jgi:hypothetical protein
MGGKGMHIVIGGKPEGNRPLRRPRRNIIEIRWDDMDWTDLT